MGRYLDDGKFVIAVFMADQTPGEALSALHVATRRAAQFEREQWYVAPIEEGKPSYVFVILCDLTGGPMESAADVRHVANHR